MAGRPPNLGGESIGTVAERSNRCREKKCLSDRDHFGLKALLRGLVPEGREIWRRKHSSHNFDSRFLERRDLRPVIVAQRLETSRKDEFSGDFRSPATIRLAVLADDLNFIGYPSVDNPFRQSSFDLAEDE